MVVSVRMKGDRGEWNTTGLEGRERGGGGEEGGEKEESVLMASSSSSAKLPTALISLLLSRNATATNAPNSHRGPGHRAMPPRRGLITMK